MAEGANSSPTGSRLSEPWVGLRRPVVSASILAFDGQISTFVPFEGPCYRCLFPTPPPAELAPSCGAAGVLGVMAGVMGLLQANEVIKLVAGIGEPLIVRLLLYDSLGTHFTELNRYVNVYLNDEDGRVLDGLDTGASESDPVVILPAMAGG